MPDHVHVMLTPQEALERSVQLIKGGFSYRAKRDLSWNGEVWQKGFSDHRIRDMRDWEQHLDYIRMNPVKARLCVMPEEYRYGFLARAAAMDGVPQRLKPLVFCSDNGGAEAPPLQ
jgi:putative transposase